MPVFIYQEDIDEKFALVEGQDYIDGLKDTCFNSEVGVAAAQLRWVKFVSKNWQDLVDKNGRERDIDEPMPNSMIYGFGGWNRYRVLGTGEVQLSNSHSNDLSRNLAIEAGFNAY